MTKIRLGRRISIASVAVLCSLAQAGEPDIGIPQLLGAQYTLIDQHQDALHSPYSGPLSLRANGDTERSHTFGAYVGVQLPWHFQFYFDAEMFKGEAVSNGTGLGAGTNGDVVHAGAANLGKRAYAARHYLRYLLPLGEETRDIEAGQDQLAGKEPVRHLEFKLGKFSVGDDFDKNRYANSVRSQFFNAGLVNNGAWDYAADTRGYTNGAMIAYAAPTWTLRYGLFQMPAYANGQTLEWPLSRARGEQLEFALQPDKDGWMLRLLAYRNIARMGVYRDAIALALATGNTPDIRADDRDGRHKHGFTANFELPLADDGETGLFARAGWNDGRTESFAYVEVDRTQSVGAQISGTHWGRGADRLAVAVIRNGLSNDHRDYLALGGSGFLLGDGGLRYADETVFEAYYRFHLVDRLDLSPDFQFVRNPGYNRDRGPVRFIGLRAHLEL